MTQSTPINQLPQPNEEQDPHTNMMVQNILDEIQSEDGQYQIPHPNQYGATQDYHPQPNYGQSNMPPPNNIPYNPQNPGEPRPVQPSLNPMTGHPPGTMAGGHYREQQAAVANGDVPQNGIKIPDVPKITLGTKVLAETKQPMIVAGLFLLFNLPIIVNLLSQYIPWMVNKDTGVPTYTGLVIRGMIIAVVYYLIVKFLV